MISAKVQWRSLQQQLYQILWNWKKGNILTPHEIRSASTEIFQRILLNQKTSIDPQFNSVVHSFDTQNENEADRKRTGLSLW